MTPKLLNFQDLRFPQPIEGAGKWVGYINGVTAELVQWDSGADRGVLFAFVRARRTPFAEQLPSGKERTIEIFNWQQAAHAGAVH